MSRSWNQFKAWIGPGILVLAAIASYAKIVAARIAHSPPDTTTIRLCHWQLEPGFREAMQELMERYEKEYFERTGERVHLVQIPINGRVYSQFINCGLIGGVAPEIIQMDRGDTVSQPSYVARFFEPMGDEMVMPNPYNAGTDLAEVAWRETFVDGLLGSYDSTLLEYYKVPFTRYTLRFFYNRDLYEKITGRTDPPQTYAEMEEFFAKTRDYNARHDLNIAPIGGSIYQMGQLTQILAHPFKSDMVLEHDLDFDGRVDPLESYLAYRDGQWTFDSPALVSMTEFMQGLADNFQPGWQAAQRDDTLFLFLQGRCVMITSGAWDAAVIPRLTEGRFSVGVFAAPIPDDHPEFGKFVKGPRNEATLPGGVQYGVNSASPHREIAIDFLRFATSQTNNEWFCNAMGWPPTIIGARAHESVEPFQPILEGFSGDFDTNLSSEIALKAEGLGWNVLAGRMTVEDYAGEMNRTLRESADGGFQRSMQQNADRLRNAERIFAGALAASVFSDDPREDKLRERATALLLDEQRDAEYRNRAAASQSPPR